MTYSSLLVYIIRWCTLGKVVSYKARVLLVEVPMEAVYAEEVEEAVVVEFKQLARQIFFRRIVQT